MPIIVQYQHLSFAGVPSISELLLLVTLANLAILWREVFFNFLCVATHTCFGAAQSDCCWVLSTTPLLFACEEVSLVARHMLSQLSLWCVVVTLRRRSNALNVVPTPAPTMAVLINGERVFRNEL